MKSVLLDENLPIPLRQALPDYNVATVRFMGWAGVQNGQLLKRIEGRFDVFVTADRNLRYQQPLSHRSFAIIELPFTRLDLLLPLVVVIRAAINSVSPGDYLTIGRE